MGSIHRLFFALNPNSRVRASILEVQAQLTASGARPVPGPRLHATLLFLGHHPDEAINVLTERAAPLEFPPCSVMLDRVGWFPRTRVMWLGASAIPDPLQKFQLALASATRDAGIDFDDRPWRLHVTLYRNMRKQPERIDFEPIDWTLTGYELMESVNDSSGLHYEVRARFGGQTEAD